MKKENKNLIIGIIIGVVSIVVIFFWLLEFKFNLSNDRDSPLSDVKEVAGLNDIVKAGDLDFKLINVYLQHGKRSRTEYYYIMVWYFEVINNGGSIENISDCGILLFEDGSQYNVGYDVDEECKYYYMVPGSRIEISSIFVFSNSSDIPSYWLVKSWEDVPGLKITYFSQQEHGLIEYMINKREIKYINELDNQIFG